MRVRVIAIGVLLVGTILTRVISDHRVKRGHADNVLKSLLNIYKMNPLRSSKVYETFSNQLLSTRPDTKRAVLNIDSNESTRLKEKRTGEKLRQIESIIHHSQKRTSSDFKSIVVGTSTPEGFMKSSNINDFLTIELNDTEDKIAKGKIQILVNNVDEKMYSDTSLNNINPYKEYDNLARKSNKKLHLRFLDDASKNIESNLSDYNENVIVLR